MKSASDVVITAAGLASPLGHDLETFARRMFAGESGVIPLWGRWAPEGFPVRCGAVIEYDTLGEAPLLPGQTGTSLKSWRMTAHATRRMFAEFGDLPAPDAIVFGTADGVSFELAAACHKQGTREEFPAHQLRSESSLDIINLILAERGLQKVDVDQMVSVNAACASGNQAIGIAFNAIRTGRWKRVVVGGVDARCEPSSLLNFHMLGALTTADVPAHKASRPFAKDRSGFVRGEGAALLFLESRAAAEERGARILGRVLGYGCTTDAWRLTDGREDGTSVVGAMQAAIRSAGLQPEDIDYVNAHGTSTPLNDRLETKALKAVFGDYATRVPISSLKSQIGHATVASSAIEAVACLLMLREQRVSPTINLDVPDPECDLDFVPHTSRSVRLRHILSNAFGFGGQNACVVIGAAE